MSKVVRRGDLVFTYVIENDEAPSTYSVFRIYKKEGDGPWTAGGRLQHDPPRQHPDGLEWGGGPGMGDDLEVKVLPEPGRRGPKGSARRSS